MPTMAKEKARAAKMKAGREEYKLVILAMIVRVEVNGQQRISKWRSSFGEVRVEV